MKTYTGDGYVIQSSDQSVTVNFNRKGFNYNLLLEVSSSIDSDMVHMKITKYTQEPINAINKELYGKECKSTVVLNDKTIHHQKFLFTADDDIGDVFVIEYNNNRFDIMFIKEPDYTE